MRAAFASQADWCALLKAPFTAQLCRLIGERIDRTTAIGQRILDWPGDPDPRRDALPLRLCGGLHALVRGGAAPALAALYPPAAAPGDAQLWDALRETFATQSEALDPWLDGPPQTNEVGRSNVLMAGLLAVAARFAQPIHLYELGASAGLNLVLDHYGFDLGGVRAGDPASPLQLRPDWRGAPPPDVKVRIAARRGADVRPGDVVADRDRLLAYVWADQAQRLRQLTTALDIAAADPLPLDRADAADWIEKALPLASTPGATQVVMHSVAFQYFPMATQGRVTAHIAAAGARASEATPVAWLRYEWEEAAGLHSLRLRTWPGEERLLAYAHPHGAWVEWLA